MREKDREMQERGATVDALQPESETIRQEEEGAAETSTLSDSFPDTGRLSVDALALRSTLRLLILQRDRAKRDIHLLEEMRAAALAEPLEFLKYTQSQKRGRGSNLSSLNSSTESNGDTESKPDIIAGNELPKPQEVYRCPPIEWSQYKILSAPLDVLHDNQRRRLQSSPSRPSGVNGTLSSPAGIPPSMQSGGIIGMPAAEFVDDGIIQGRMRLFDGIAQRGRVVGR